MLRSFMRPVPALVLALAAGAAPLGAVSPTLTPNQVAALKTQQSSRAAQAQAAVMKLGPQLNLGPAAGFLLHQSSTNAQGRTVARFHQTHEGRRVWAGEAVAHVESDGRVNMLTQGLKPQVALATASARLSADQAKAIALRNLAPKGPMPQAPKVEEVVFPTRFTGGLATRVDSVKKREVWDKEMSLWAKTPAEPYVRAYEVRTLLTNRQDGHREICYIIDADTGAILRKWDAIQSDSPAQGTGQSYFRGPVPLSTSAAGDGTFSLVAQDRGTLPQPTFQMNGIDQVGLTTCYGAIDWATGMIGFDVYKGTNTTNTWGNGELMPLPWDFAYDPGTSPNPWGAMLLDFSTDQLNAWGQGATGLAGETTAVDCHYGLSTTWDFYKNVFNRDGIDNLGTSTFGVVHSIDADWFSGPYPYFDNAYWAPWLFGMVFGDGSFGTPWGAGGYGMKALTEIDITGHELTHGVTEYTAALIYSGQSGGLNEGNSDIFGKMVQAYADGGAQGAAIPDFPVGDVTKWEVGRYAAGDPSTPLRFMHKPSLDGTSADGWFDGIDMIDVHYSSGPVNRFFYFLACGASSSTGSETYSPYLPAGMAGIGNDAAARIWYKALTEYLLPDSDFEAARTASITAAQDLHGIGSPEEAAVMKAWAAVNVGQAPGQAPRVRVTFPVINGEGSWLDAHVQPTGILKKVQVFPTRTNVQVACNVEYTTNKAVTFTTPTWHGFAPAGAIKADGTWTTPNWNYYEDLLNIQATSQADPSQFARTWTLLVNLDADSDTEIDALDLGSTAMSWGKPGAYFETPNPSARIAGGGDWDVEFFNQAFTGAFPVK